MDNSKFTNKLKAVLSVAMDEARVMKVDEVGTEHFLLAIYKFKNSMVYKFLESYGLTEDVVRKSINGFINYFPRNEEIQGDIRYSDKLNKALEEAYKRSLKFGHNAVGSSHVTLVLLEDGGIANFILGLEGISTTELKNDIINFLGNTQASESVGNKKYSDKGRGFVSERYKFQTPVLDSVSRDLTLMAEEGKIDPMIGRQKELKRMVEILARRSKNNPILIGEPGVGKSALAEGLALTVIGGKLPRGPISDKLSNSRIVQLDLNSVVASTKYRGEFEEKLKKVINEVQQAGNIILFIDEIHTMIGAGGSEGALDASNILKPFLSRGEIKCIGATTIDEYKKYFEKDSALERRFQPIQLNEPSETETIEILNGLKERYEEFHSVIITDEAIESAVKLSSRYITERQLPDKAIDLIDEASVKVIYGSESGDDVIILIKEIEEVRQEKQRLFQLGDFIKASECRSREMELYEQLKELKVNLNEDSEVTDEMTNNNYVLESHIADVVSNWTGVPVSRLNEGEGIKLLNLADKLHKTIIGQDDAVEAISRSVKRSRAGLQDPSKPIGSFLFLGPTGVGKTELAKSLAKELFDDENSMIRIDMSEYMEKHTVSRLVGAPPGYVGYDDGGQLTEKVRRKPYSVILLDEIEKAHPDVFNILLQILDDGRLTDGRGKVVNFKNTIIIMTSNLGVSEIKNTNTLGFGSDSADSKNKNLKDKILKKLKDTLKPEFLNRIDETIVFHYLEEEHLLQIVDLISNDLKERLALNGYLISMDKSVYNKVLKEGTNVEFGARPLKRAMQRVVEDFLSDEVLKGNFIEGEEYKLKFNDEKDTLVLTKTKAKSKPKNIELVK